jgi:colicin import membrane protein
MSSRDETQVSSNLSLPFIGAITIHFVVGALLLGSWQFSYKKPVEFEIPKHIKAEMVAIEAPKPAPVVKPKPKPAVKPKPKPIAKPVAKPKPTPKPKETPVVKETVAPVEKVIDLSKETLAAETVTPEPVQEKEPEVPAATEEDLFESLLAGLAAEETAINDQLEVIEQNKQRDSEIQAQVSDYISAITLQVEQQWSRPAELRLMDLSNIEALVSVELLPTGELQDASILRSSGNENYDQSVLRALEKVRRYKVPTDSEVFEAGGFRRLNITFRPEDLLKP